MKVVSNNLLDVLEIFPPRFKDNRGFFSVPYNKELFKKMSIPSEYVQDNESFSTAGVLRGLHFQTGEHAQAKLVRVIKGRVQDVIVDLRLDSPTHGEWGSFILSADVGNMLYVPRGFAHGFLALEDSIFTYKVDNGYCKEAESGIRWDDPDLAIEWMHNPMIISDKDQELPSYIDLTTS